MEVVVSDNASTDDTPSILRSFESRIRVIQNVRNLGFAAGQNRAIRECRSADWVLTLNPDVLLEPGFVRRLVESGASDSSVGAVCGKLLSIAPGFQPLPVPRIDSAGIIFTPNMRHFDRGWHERDEQRYDAAEYVFGASAAAALYRREMIEDVAIDGEFFDSDFFVYREDADVAWRAQLLGWKCIYVPYARGYHVRKVLPGNRGALPPEINMHSVKNRFLMRIKNISPDLYRRNMFSITFRDIMVVMCCLAWEHTSLRAFWFLARNWRRVMAKRAEIQRRRRVDHAYIASWFKYTPVSVKAPKKAPRLVGRSQAAKT